MKKRALKCTLLSLCFLFFLLQKCFFPKLESYTIGVYGLNDYVNLCLIDGNYFGYYLMSTFFLVLCFFMTYYTLGKERVLHIMREGKASYYTRRYRQVIILTLSFALLINGVSYLFLFFTGAGPVLMEPVYLILFVFQNIIIMSLYALIYLMYEIVSIFLGELMGMSLTLGGSISFLLIMQNVFTDHNIMRPMCCYDYVLMNETLNAQNTEVLTFSKLLIFVLIFLALLIFMKMMYLESYERKDYLKNEKR